MIQKVSGVVWVHADGRVKTSHESCWFLPLDANVT